ncbi:hypothetical protein HPB47_012295 [Ixodes persulcatus]|uniref:Uncharacterized protein n=1 Tax=Ixodes persulcatus TaxID=34615 RepID=A0AC60NU07_IXOPE|nr:hypothetical protein HPB47_012295 [Ixodes persulcatus]
MDRWGTRGMKKLLVVNQLAAVGGSSVGNNTRGVLEQLMTQKVAVELSWLGQREKRKFKDHEYPDVIYRHGTNESVTAFVEDVLCLIENPRQP